MTGRGIKIGSVPVPALSMSLNPQRNIITEDSFGIATQGSVYAGTYGISGSVTAGYRPSTLSTITNLVLGGSSTIATTGVFAYTTVDVEDDFGNISSFASCVINSMELSLNTGDFARVTYNFTGIKKKANGSITSPVYTESISVFYNALLTIDSTAVKAKSVTLRIERPITPDFILGSEYAETIIQSGNLTVSGSLGLAANEYTQLYNAMYTSDESRPQPSNANVNLLGGGILVIELRKPGGSAFQTITVGQIYITTGTMSADGRQVMTKSVDFTAQVNDVNNVVFSAVS